MRAPETGRSREQLFAQGSGARRVGAEGQLRFAPENLGGRIVHLHSE
jgi:hypothetical protein